MANKYYSNIRVSGTGTFTVPYHPSLDVNDWEKRTWLMENFWGRGSSMPDPVPPIPWCELEGCDYNTIEASNGDL